MEKRNYKVNDEIMLNNTEQCFTKMIESLLEEKWINQEISLIIPYIPVHKSKEKIVLQLLDKSVFSDFFEYNYLKQLFNESYFKLEDEIGWNFKISMSYINKIKYSKSIRKMKI